MAKSKVSKKALRNMITKQKPNCKPRVVYEDIPIIIPEGTTCEDYIPEKDPDLIIIEDPLTITMCCCTYTEWTKDLIFDLYFISCANNPKVVVNGVTLNTELSREYLYNIIRNYQNTH